MSISIRARVALAAAAVVAVWSTAADAATPKGSAKYYGGHVISHVNVVPVMWGTGAAKDVVAGAEKFYGTVVASPYMDWLGEYDTVGLMGEGDQKPGSNQRIHRGTASPLVTITPSTTSKTVTDAQIQKELLAQIASGALPAPKVDADGGVDTVYMFSFPAGYTVKDFGGQDVCSGACAYHWTVSAPGISAGVPYGVIPDCSASKTNYCALGTVFETYTGDASHELLEAITDPECGLVTTQAASRPLGWFDPAQANEEGEIADICLSDPTTFTTYLGYTVQAVWSQRLGKCITNDPSLTLCDGAAHPCRPCTATDCSGGTSCDEQPTSTTLGQCITPGATGGGSGSGGDGTGTGGGSNGGTGGGATGGTGSSNQGSDPGASSGGGTSASNGNDVSNEQGGCAVSSRSGSPLQPFGLALACAALVMRLRSRRRRGALR